MSNLKWIALIMVFLSLFFAGQVVQVSQEEEPPPTTEVQQSPVQNQCCVAGLPCCMQ
jgi:hypothetical protein